MIYYCRECKVFTRDYDIGHKCKACGAQLIIKNFKYNQKED